MKKWTGVLLSLILLMLLTYYFMGYIVKDTLHKNIHALIKTPILSVHLNDYKRGWFSSQALLKLKMHVPAQTTTDKNGVSSTQPPVDFDLNFPLMIHHGPFIKTDTGIRFGIGAVTTQPETHYGVLITYLNRTFLKYTLPSFSMKGTVGGTPNEAFQVNWLGLIAEVEATTRLKQITGSLTLNGLNASAAKTSVNISKLMNQFKVYRTKENLWLGYNTLSIPLIEVEAAQSKTFQLNQFIFRIGSGIRQKSLNIDYAMSLKQLLVNGNSYGPGSFKLSLKNLNPTAMAQIHKQEVNLLENEGNPTLASLALLAELPQLLSQGPELELSDCSFRLPDGIVTGYLRVSLPKSDAITTDKLLKSASGEGQFKAPMTLVKQLLVQSLTTNQPENKSASSTDISTSSTIAPISNEDPEKKADQILKNYADKGLLKIEGSDYIIHFTLENQQMKINGQVFNPDTLQ